MSYCILCNKIYEMHDLENNCPDGKGKYTTREMMFERRKTGLLLDYTEWLKKNGYITIDDGALTNALVDRYQKGY